MIQMCFSIVSSGTTSALIPKMQLLKLLSQNGTILALINGVLVSQTPIEQTGRSIERQDPMETEKIHKVHGQSDVRHLHGRYPWVLALRRASSALCHQIFTTQSESGFGYSLDCILQRIMHTIFDDRHAGCTCTRA